MHDSFNLAWKLNLVIRGLAKRALLFTYEEERQKIAYDLIKFDAEHCKAFSQGEAALARNFDENIRFISGIGAEYSAGILTRHKQNITTKLQPGALQLPGKVTRFIDANPVDIQLDIPMLSQFRLFFFIPNVSRAKQFLASICDTLTSPATTLGNASSRAVQSYTKHSRGETLSDEFVQPQRYTSTSNIFTVAMITQSPKSTFEIADLPESLQDSRWTMYLDDTDTPRCTEKWFGILGEDDVGVAIGRPDGYIGSIDIWELSASKAVEMWIEEYFTPFM